MFSQLFYDQMNCVKTFNWPDVSPLLVENIIFSHVIYCDSSSPPSTPSSSFPPPLPYRSSPSAFHQKTVFYGNRTEQNRIDKIKLTHWNWTKQTNKRKESKKGYKKQMQTHRNAPLHTKEFLENIKMEAMIYMQRNFRVKKSQ